MKEGWEYKKLGDLALSMADGPFGSNLKKEHYTNRKEVRIIQLSNIGEEGWRDENTKYTTYEHLDSIKRSEVLPGDVVIAKMMPAGRAILCPNKESKYVLSSDAVRVTLKKGLNNRFILFSINSPYFRKQVYDNVSGSGRVRTSLTKLRNCKVGLPPLSEQQSIVDYLDSAFAKIDAMKANAEKALNEAKALFQASLKEMLEPKEGWEEKKLKEICETITDFVAAGSFASLRENVVYNNEKDYAQLVRTTDLKSGFSKGGYVYVNEHAFKYLYRVNLDKECIILPNVGVNCGEVYYVTPSILPYNNNVLGPNAVLVRSNNYNNHFLSYLFLGKDFQNKLSDITSHMAQPKFNKTGLKEIVILVPPQYEQQSIVATLDSLKSKVDRLQENYDKISQECDALKQAILRQVFE